MKALYFVLDLDYAIPFLLGIIWKPWILSKMSFFAWKAFMGMVLTLDLHQGRCWSLVNRCLFAKWRENPLTIFLLHHDISRILC